MASPLITTIVDAGAVLIYFQAAAALLRLPFKGSARYGRKTGACQKSGRHLFPIFDFHRRKMRFPPR